VFERFTDSARRVLVLAQQEALLLSHSFIGTEHILLGLVGDNQGVTAEVFTELDISLEAARHGVQDMVGPSISNLGIGSSPPFTPRAKKVLEYSMRESLQLGHNYIGPEHMLLGIVQEGHGVAVHVLMSLGADIGRVRQAVIEHLEASSPSNTASSAVAIAVPEEATEGQVGSLVSCSFCGCLPPDTGRLVSGTDAFICERCLDFWSGQVRQGEPRRLLARRRTRFSQVRKTGPPPDDQDAARTAIERAFAQHGTQSDDGRSLPFVEGGDNLGPTVRAAAERHPGVYEGSTVTISIDQVSFVDETHAAVWFSVSVDNVSRLRNHRGDAVVVDGEWKMARSTFCGLMAMAGVQCPPE
jgi:hypothetical protein